MRVLLSVSVLVIITILLSVHGYNLIRSNTDDLLFDLGDLEIATKKNDWSKASSLDKKLNKNWSEANKILPVLIDHAELHDLETFIAKISILIELHEEERLLTEISAAKELLKNIPLQEKLTIRNIL